MKIKRTWFSTEIDIDFKELHSTPNIYRVAVETWLDKYIGFELKNIMGDYNQTLKEKVSELEDLKRSIK